MALEGLPPRLLRPGNAGPLLALWETHSGSRPFTVEGCCIGRGDPAPEAKQVSGCYRASVSFIRLPEHGCQIPETRPHGIGQKRQHSAIPATS